MLDKYKLVGPAYDALSKAYSGDAIHRCKLAMLRADTLGPESNVLFAGAGLGKDAIHAATLGAHVTVVDISPTMLSRLEKNVAKHPQAQDLKVDTFLGDILKFENFGHYDVVVANFFLNVFDREKMTILLQHLSRHCKRGGAMIIGDFKPGQGNAFKQSFRNLYWYAAASAFFLAAGNAIHQIYDYAPMLEKLGFEIAEQQDIELLGMDIYYALRAIRQ